MKKIKAVASVIRAPDAGCEYSHPASADHLDSLKIESPGASFSAHYHNICDCMFRYCLRTEAADIKRLRDSDVPENYIRGRVRTAPTEILRLIAESELRRSFNDLLHGVAGFYRDPDGLWRLNLPVSGIIVAVLNARRLIVGLQMYRPAIGKSPFWITSKERSYGAMAKANAHFARPDLSRSQNTIVILNNTLRAEAFAAQCGIGTLGANGLTAKALVETITASLPEVRVVVNAIIPTDEHAVRTSQLLPRMLRRVGLGVSEL